MKYINHLFFQILVLFSAFTFLSCGSARVRSLQLTAREPSPEKFLLTKNKDVIPVADFSLIRYDRDSVIALQTENTFRRHDGDVDNERVLKGQMNLNYLYMNTNMSN